MLSYNVSKVMIFYYVLFYFIYLVIDSNVIFEMRNTFFVLTKI